MAGNRILKFPCEYCDTELEVPLSMAGVSGPCPTCGERITAPASEPLPPAVSGSQIPLEEPERVFRQDRPPAGLPRRRKSLTEELQELERRQAVMRATGEVGQVVRKKGALRGGPNLAKILTWGTVALVAFAAAALYFAKKGPWSAAETANPAPVAAAGPSAAKDALDEKQTQAVRQAVDVVREFLAKGAPADGGHLIKAVAGDFKPFPHPLFPDLEPSSLFPAKVSRKPSSEDFVTELESPEGPTFIVEQTDGSSRIQADALVQQMEDTVGNFLEDTSAPPLTCYLLAKPFSASHPDAELDALKKLDLRTPFGNQPRGFIGLFDEKSLVGLSVSQYAASHHWNSWVNVQLEVQWKRSKNGQTYIEISKILKNAWAKL